MAGNLPVADSLAQGWGIESEAAIRLLNAALILCADHELNVSTFAARITASGGGTPYSVVLAGLAALQGVKHGGNTESVAAFLREVSIPAAAQTVIAGRLRRGERIPGFGHTLYPTRDPRAVALFRLIAAHYPQSPALALAYAVTDAMQSITVAPNIDFALVTLADTLGLPDGAALAIFALGRTAGWIAHAIEQYHDDKLIRPRARYTGRPPT